MWTKICWPCIQDCNDGELGSLASQIEGNDTIDKLPDIKEFSGIEQECKDEIKEWGAYIF